MGVSLKPSDYTTGGGLLDDVDVTIAKAAFAAWDYGGTRSDKVPALQVTLTGDEVDGEHEQFFSAGSAKDFAPSKDGKELMSIGSRTSLNDSSNAAIFLKSLIDAGFPEDDLGDDITAIEGVNCHVKRVPAPERKGLKKRDGDREATVLVVTELNEAKKAKGKAVAAKGKTVVKGKKGKGDDADIAAEAEKAVLAVLTNLPDDETLEKADIPSMVLAQVKGQDNAKQIMSLAYTDKFLSDEARPWTYDADEGTITL